MSLSNEVLWILYITKYCSGDDTKGIECWDAVAVTSQRGPNWGCVVSQWSISKTRSTMHSAQAPQLSPSFLQQLKWKSFLVFKGGLNGLQEVFFERGGEGARVLSTRLKPLYLNLEGVSYPHGECWVGTKQDRLPLHVTLSSWGSSFPTSIERKINHPFHSVRLLEKH